MRTATKRIQSTQAAAASIMVHAYHMFQIYKQPITNNYNLYVNTNTFIISVKLKLEVPVGVT